MAGAVLALGKERTLVIFAEIGDLRRYPHRPSH